jgi:polysaccharide biosynthesis protein VpsM
MYQTYKNNTYQMVIENLPPKLQDPKNPMKTPLFVLNILILLLSLFAIRANICIAETPDTFNASETGHTGVTNDTIKPTNQPATSTSERPPQKPNETRQAPEQSDDSSKEDTSKNDDGSKSDDTSKKENTTKTEPQAEHPVPRFAVALNADVQKLDAPATITWTLRIENTGNLALTRINITAPLLENLKGPEGDGKPSGVLDVNETWTYTGTYMATQATIDGNGVDTYNVIDGDGDIDNTVMVSFAETDAPQTASAAVATPITGDIFEKKYRNFHAFLTGQREFTTNLYKMDANPESCWSTILTPGVWATYPSNMKRSVDIITANASPGGLAIDPFNPADFRDFQVYALYSPSLEIYHDENLSAHQDPDISADMIDDNDSDRLSHRIDAMIHYDSGNKLAIRAMDQYKISYDAFSERAYWTDDEYTSNVFNIANTLDPTEKIQLRLDYSNFRLNYDDSFNSDDDRKDNVYSAYLFFRQTSKLSYFVEYDYADIGYDSSDRDNHEHRYFGGVRWEMTGKSSGQIKGGYGKKKSDESSMIDSDVDVSDISENNWMAAIQLDHNFDSRTNLTLNAYRRYDEVLEHRYDYNQFEDFYADYILAHFVGAKFSRQIRHNIQVNLDSSVFFDDFKNSRYNNINGEDEDREDLEFAVSPSVKVDLSKYFSINGGYIYTDHDSNYPAVDYVDHTFFILASLFL